MKKIQEKNSIKQTKRRNRDHTKIMIIKYLFSKNKDEMASLYEILHHGGISMLDYPYLKKILQEMIDSGWIRTITSGPNRREKQHYALTERGRQFFISIKGFEKSHPLWDLDTFDI